MRALYLLPGLVLLVAGNVAFAYGQPGPAALLLFSAFGAMGLGSNAADRRGL